MTIEELKNSKRILVDAEDVAKILGCTVDDLIAEPEDGELYFRSVKNDATA